MSTFNFLTRSFVLRLVPTLFLAAAITGLWLGMQHKRPKVVSAQSLPYCCTNALQPPDAMWRRPKLYGSECHRTTDGDFFYDSYVLSVPLATAVTINAKCPSCAVTAIDYPEVFLYKDGFYPLFPCHNMVNPRSQSPTWISCRDSRAVKTYDLPAGNYIVVVTTQYAQKTGTYALSVGALPGMQPVSFTCQPYAPLSPEFANAGSGCQSAFSSTTSNWSDHPSGYTGWMLGDPCKKWPLKSRYQVFPVTISERSAWVFTTCGSPQLGDGNKRLFLYKASFNPNQPCENLVAASTEDGACPTASQDQGIDTVVDPNALGTHQFFVVVATTNMRPRSGDAPRPFKLSVMSSRIPAGGPGGQGAAAFGCTPLQPPAPTPVPTPHTIARCPDSDISRAAGQGFAVYLSGDTPNQLQWWVSRSSHFCQKANGEIFTELSDSNIHWAFGPMCNGKTKWASPVSEFIDDSGTEAISPWDIGAMAGPGGMTLDHERRIHTAPHTLFGVATPPAARFSDLVSQFGCWPIMVSQAKTKYDLK